MRTVQKKTKRIETNMKQKRSTQDKTTVTATTLRL